ncbi:MAG: type II toxin-antitoxin system VapC family toxin [Rhodoplanes sp.]|jgi:predicted nucleic acid-binding protein
MTFVLDASTTAAWCFPDESDPAADEAFNRLDRENAAVPALWWVEIRNILVVGERRGRIDAAESARFLSDLDQLPIHLDREPAGDLVMALARKHALSVYDAVYLELASRLASPIATLDRTLATAARASGVPVIGEGSG